MKKKYLSTLPYRAKVAHQFPTSQILSLPLFDIQPH